MYTKAAMSAPVVINPSTPLDPQTIYAGIQDHYGSAAAANNTANSQYGHTVASAFGYSPSELATAPSESNLGLSCGNPFAIANLREGETVVDLGSGAGFDVFQAAKKVGLKGRVWGVDMNDVSEQCLSFTRHQKEKEWRRGAKEGARLVVELAHKWRI